MRTAGALFLILFWFSACGGDKPASKIPGGATQAAGAGKALPTAAKKELEIPSIFGPAKDGYSYNPVGKRDPFQKYQGETAQDVALPRSPLEQFPLDQLKVTAIVTGIANPRALVTSPSNESFIVKENMRIGKNRGRVARITKRALYVEEEYRDPTGKLIVRESVMEIRSKKDEDSKSPEIQYSEE